MSVDLETQIRELWLATSADLPELDAQKLMQASEEAGVVRQYASPPIRRGRSRWRVATAAATFVFLAILVVVWVLPSSGDQKPVIAQPGLSPLSWQPASFADPDVLVDAIAVLDAGDRLVVVHGLDSIEAVSTSFDGVTWTRRPLAEPEGSTRGIILAAWEGTIATVTGGGGFSQEEEGGPLVAIPSTVAILFPDGAVNRRVFDADAQSVAMGPAGIVVAADSNVTDDLIVHNVLGQEFFDNLAMTDLRDGVLYAETHDGQSAEVVLSEHGYDPKDIGRTDGWYSSDGQEWSLIPDFPTGILSLVGTRDGFVGIAFRGAEAVAWHSADGQTWRDLGSLGFGPGLPLVRWKEGALVTDGVGYAFVSADGIEELPVPFDPRAVPNDVPPPASVTGPFGIVTINLPRGKLLHSPDGIAWTITDLPREITQAGASSSGQFSASAAATEDGVLMLLWEGERGEQRPSWWLGTLS